MLVACLHTVKSNFTVFDEAARALGIPGLELSHSLRDDLLARAEAAGCLTDDIRNDAAAALVALAGTADAVLLTCSTLGPATAVAQGAAAPVLRVDEALAEEALASGGNVLVLCATETTLEPTGHLFATVAARQGGTFTIRLVPGAWDLRKAGDQAGYFNLIAEAVDKGRAEGFHSVALAQATMAGAAASVATRPLPFISPMSGLRAAARAAAGTR